MTRPVVVIPFTNRADLTIPLVDRIYADGGFRSLVLADNGSDDPKTTDWLGRLRTVPKVEVVRYPALGARYVHGLDRPHSLYRSWNLAIEWAARVDDVAVILNNDLTVPERFVPRLAEALAAAPADVAIAYPDTLGTRHPADEPITRTRGLWPDGMTPFAFAIDPGRYPTLPQIDERFILYCGDVELLWRTQATGLTAARVNGLPVEHRLGSTRKAGNWWDTIAADRAYREAKWPHGPRSEGLSW